MRIGGRDEVEGWREGWREGGEGRDGVGGVRRGRTRHTTLFLFLFLYLYCSGSNFIFSFRFYNSFFRF